MIAMNIWYAHPNLQLLCGVSFVVTIYCVCMNRCAVVPRLQNTTQPLATPLLCNSQHTCNVNKLTYYTTLDFVLVFQRDTLRLALFLNHGYYLYLLTILWGVDTVWIRFCSLLAWLALNNQPSKKMGGSAYPLSLKPITSHRYEYS